LPDATVVVLLEELALDFELEEQPATAMTMTAMAIATMRDPRFM
jgi:hypothetical protein